MKDKRALTLHGYWRSSTSYRTRIALNIKGLDYAQVTHDLRTGAQKAPDYLGLQPQGLVPALETCDTVLTQSSAILEWLDETHPAPPLLPADATCRAIVRAMAMVVACDIHPLNNLRVLKYLRRPLGQDEAAVSRWIAQWIAEGFSALEHMVAKHGGAFAYGDTLTLADCHLVPQLYAAERFNVPLEAYPHLLHAARNAGEVAAVAAAHPVCQPDADAV